MAAETFESVGGETRSEMPSGTWFGGTLYSQQTPVFRRLANTVEQGSTIFRTVNSGEKDE